MSYWSDRYTLHFFFCDRENKLNSSTFHEKSLYSFSNLLPLYLTFFILCIPVSFLKSRPHHVVLSETLQFSIKLSATGCRIFCLISGVRPAKASGWGLRSTRSTAAPELPSTVLMGCRIMEGNWILDPMAVLQLYHSHIQMSCLFMGQRNTIFP